MTKNEVKALIRKKMETAEKDYLESLTKHNFNAKNRFDECAYYLGVKQGLQDTLQVIGMLDSEHNRLKSSL
jgi:hypothetical protein